MWSLTSSSLKNVTTRVINCMWNSAQVKQIMFHGAYPSHFSAEAMHH